MLTRRRAACALLVAFAAFVHVQAQRHEGVLVPQTNPPGFSVEARFAPLRAALPPGGRAGWVCDLDRSSKLGPIAWLEYTAAASALVPVVLEDSNAPALVVASLHQGHRPNEEVYRIVVDRGDGVYLLARRRP